MARMEGHALEGLNRRPVCPVCGRPAVMTESVRSMGGWPVSYMRRLHRMICPMGHVRTDWYDGAEDAYRAWLDMCAWTTRKGDGR